MLSPHSFFKSNFLQILSHQRASSMKNILQRRARGKIKLMIIIKIEINYWAQNASAERNEIDTKSQGRSRSKKILFI